MNIIDFIQRDDYNVSMTLRLERSEWEPWIKAAALELQKNGRIQGFRPGKAPLKLLEAKFGKLLYQSAAMEAQNVMLVQACEQKDLTPVSDPVVTVAQADGEALALSVSFWTYPELTKLNYRGLRVERPVRVVSEADIDREAENFRRNHLLLQKVTRGVQVGDLVEVAFRAAKEGYSFSYDRSEQARFIVGEGRIFAGLDEALLGHVAGDELDLDLTMPKGFHRDDIAGLTIHVHIRLKSVEERVLQELDDAFVQRYVKDCDSLADYRNQLRTRLETAYSHRAEELYRRNLEQALADAVTVPIPESMYRTNLDRYIAGLASAAKAKKQTVEELLSEEGKTPEQYLQEIVPLARLQVKLSVAHDYIASHENMTINEEEIQRWIEQRAQALEMTANDLLVQIGGTERVADELLRIKIAELLHATAKAVDVEIDRLPGEDPTRPVLMN